VVLDFDDIGSAVKINEVIDNESDKNIELVVKVFVDDFLEETNGNR
jgi:hypothetical protein